MASNKEMYFQDLYSIRMSVLDKVLKSEKPQTEYLELLPELIDKSRHGLLTEKDKKYYKIAFKNYKHALYMLIKYSVSDMFFKQDYVNLSEVFRFVFGGAIDTSRFSDHITNKCFTNMFHSLDTSIGFQWKYHPKEHQFSEAQLNEMNNVTKTSIKQLEYDYIKEHKAPGFAYILLAFIFNVNVLEGQYSEYIHEKDIYKKKYYLFVDVFEDRTNIITLQMFEDSIYADIFFKLYLDEIMQDFKKTLNTLGDNFKVQSKSSSMNLHDPSKRE